METIDQGGAAQNRKNNRLQVSGYGLGARIAAIATSVGGKKRLAELVNISEGHLYRYISEANEPTASKLVALAHIGEVSLDWLLTGRESGQQVPSEGVALDLEVLESLGLIAFEELQERALSLEPATQARLLRVLYRHFVGRGETPDRETIRDFIDLAARNP
ncbi:transcriptional regulator [Halorhodospira halochloris]|uniref:Transcriptional regulator n=1 Tax=Halorhodospira halochloris TaxID=1052 RepID=A0A0X8XAY0_HALHR|nr:helix-turn-helix domain-containing protein [Halorhodospira halochloris]MBK1651757.1 hypothetical protein [Halorhodospira halochloris]BAU58625.1 transcriptional regulator [Halorhodospira halochloris]